MSRRKPLIAAAAEVSSNKVNAIWPATSRPCMRLPWALLVVRREPACISRETCGRENWMAGAEPDKTPVRMAMVTLNTRTGRLMPIATSCGNENSGSQLISSGSRR